jgi:hypothetical protein
MNGRYLDLPAHVGRTKGNTWAYLKDRVWRRIQGWKEKMLSWAGKEIFIKAVARAIPTFLQWVALKSQKVVWPNKRYDW